MNILITAATVLEIQRIEDFLKKEGNSVGMYRYDYNDHLIATQVTGIGSVHVAFALARYPKVEQFDVIINVGIAGSFNTDLSLGDVVIIAQDRFADIGMQQIDGSFSSLWDGDLAPKHYPYDDLGWIQSEMPKSLPDLPKVKSITLNTVTGTNTQAEALKKEYQADIESMESAAFIYACKMLQIKHLPLRAISNYVEDRDKSTWQIGKALDNLTNVLTTYLKSL